MTCNATYAGTGSGGAAASNLPTPGPTDAGKPIVGKADGTYEFGALGSALVLPGADKAVKTNASNDGFVEMTNIDGGVT